MKKETLTVQVNYSPSPWPDPRIERGWVFSGWLERAERIVSRPELLLWPDRREDPVQTDSQFWRKVRQTNSEEDILRLYRRYGTVLGQEPESLSLVKKRLDWFSRLTEFVEHLKHPTKENLGEILRETLGEPIDLESEDAVGSFRPGDIEGPVAGFLLPSSACHVMWRTAKDRAGIVNEAWKRVFWAVAQFLRDIPLVPVVSRDPPVNIKWAFHASGVLQAAFLQWFFQEIAYIETRKCPECGQTLHSPRQKYCRTCREKLKKRRYRERLKNRNP